MTIRDSVAFVTGANRGLGLAFAQALLPPAIHLASAVFLLALSALLVAAHGALLFAAAGRSELPARARLWGPALATAFLALWLGVSITVGDGANFPLPASAQLPVRLAVGFGTMLLALGCLRGSATLRASTPRCRPSGWCASRPIGWWG